MLPLTLLPSKVCVFQQPVDFRKGLDGLSLLVHAAYGPLAAMSGTGFVFFNRNGSQLKILLFDRHGFWLLLKRLEQGRFSRPSIAELTAAELALLLEGVDLKVRRFASVAPRRVA